MSTPAPAEPGSRSSPLERVRGLWSFDLTLLAEHFPRSVLAPQLTLPSLVGFDEAGRGALAGPVAVGCVSFPLRGLSGRRGVCQDDWVGRFLHLNDSKQVTPRRREVLCLEIQAQAIAWGVGFASAAEVDRLGIVAACRTAAGRAWRRLYRHEMPIHEPIGLFDHGLSLPDELSRNLTDCRQITRGDCVSFHIAAASIVAKATRDRIMRHLADRAPDHDFAGHKGYGTRAHLESIRRHGASKFHRKTFLS